MHPSKAPERLSVRKSARLSDSGSIISARDEMVDQASWALWGSMLDVMDRDHCSKGGTHWSMTPNNSTLGLVGPVPLSEAMSDK